MLSAFITGLLAGVAAAVPIGAVAVLLLDVAHRRGFSRAAAGGLGIAGADTLFAAAAVLLAGAAARLLANWTLLVNIVSAVTLVVVALLAVRSYVTESRDARPGGNAHDLSESEARSGWLTFAVFLRAALVHPVTLVFYLALTLGLTAGFDSWAAGAVFVAGVFIASAAWHVLLARVGSRRKAPLSQRTRLIVLILDCGIVAVFVVVILTQPAAA